MGGGGFYRVIGRAEYIMEIMLSFKSIVLKFRYLASNHYLCLS